MTSRKFSGSWNGNERTVSAELHREVAELTRVHLAQLGEAHPAEPGEELRHRLLEFCGIGRRQQYAHVAHSADQAFSVARGGREKQFAQAAACGRGDLAHHAEVDERQHPRMRSVGDRRHEDVAGMRISVEEAVREQLVEHHRREHRRHVCRVDAGRPQRLSIGDLDRRHVAECEHASGRALPDDRGHCHPVVALEVARETFATRGLVQVVDLLEAGARELLDECGRIDPVGHETHPAEPSAHPAQCGQVDVDDRTDAGPLHLDDDLFEAGLGRIRRGEQRAMRLAEGCCSHRRLVDHRERALERKAELRFGKSADAGERHRRNLVLQPLQLGRDLRRQHVEPRRHELADLDHQAAELHSQRMEALREVPHPFRTGARRDPREPDAREEQLVPPRHGQLPAGETQDAAVAGTRGSRVWCARTRTDLRHPRQS